MNPAVPAKLCIVKNLKIFISGFHLFFQGMKRVFANMRSDSVIAMELCDGWTPALFMLFFVLSGAELDFSILLTVGIPGVIYIIARSAGKYFGAFTGAAMSHLGF